MPTKKQNIETPSATIRTPKAEPKRASKRPPEAATGDTPKNRPKPRPQRTPKPAPINSPNTTPETITLSPYSLPHWELDRSSNPHRYGNGGKALGEFHTEADIKDWLRRNGHTGHFAIVERINGKIGKSWHIEIEPLEEFDLIDDSDSDLSLLDEDDLDDAQLLNPDVVRAKIENAKLKAELKAASRNGAQTSVSELLQSIKMLDELRGQGAQQKSFIEQFREIKEVNELIIPRREQPQPTAPQPRLSDDAVILNALANNDAIAGKVKNLVKSIFTDKAEKEEISLADVAMEAVKNGELSKSIGALGTVAQNIFAMFVPGGAQQQPMPPQQTPQPQPAQQSQPTTMDAQPAQQSISAISPDAAYQETMSQVLTMLANNSPVEEAVKTINGFLFLYPQYADAIDMQLGQAPEMLLSTISAIPGCEPLAMLTHAKEWIENFQKAFFPDEEIEPNETSTPN